MKQVIAKFNKNRISRTLWRSSSNQSGFRWFHEQGLPSPYVLNEVKVEIASQPSPEILQLRLLAAQHAGRLLDVKNPQCMADDLDELSILINLRLHKQIVATGRLTFPKGNRQNSEINRHLVSLPNHILFAPGTVEISRVCTHPDFRGGHLLMLLLTECAWQAYIHGGQTLLGFCLRNLVPIYTRFAGQELPFKGRHHLYGGQESYVIQIDLHKVMSGDSVPWIPWIRFLAPRLALRSLLRQAPKPRVLLRLLVPFSKPLRPYLDFLLELALIRS